MTREPDHHRMLDERTVLAFLDGTLPIRMRDDIEAHLGTCHPCADLVTWAGADVANVDRPPGREGRPFLGRLPPGTRMGRYRVLGAVGRGAMGEVYDAYQEDLDRRVALKVSFGTGTLAEQKARLLREAKAAAKLSHSNVVAVYDAGTIEDRAFIAMELVEGETLDGWLARKPRKWREIVDVFFAAGRGLAAAHAAGIIHQDFKPQNVMIGVDGSVRITDFGLAQVVRNDDDATMPRAGALLGTPAYMAPEQFRCEFVDARADQFSFCVALHEALYGTRPTLTRVGVPRPTLAPKRRTRAPSSLHAIVWRGLDPEPNRRFPTMIALLGAIDRASRQRPWR
jgi:serine/threonine protein kinase